MTVVLLGPQRAKPVLAGAMAARGIAGRVATITAGWQENEDDDADLDADLGGRAVNLKLHARGEQVFRDDADLAAAYKKRQERLRQLQDLYRVRLDHALEAVRALDRRDADPQMLADERQSAIEAVRTLDEHHLERCRTIHAEFDARWRPAERPTVARHRRELEDLVKDAEAVCIAGGHVAVLLNRLKLFGVSTLRGERPVFAWSAGAMATAEKVVLFHDSPPQGPAIAEVLDTGAGLHAGVVPLPDAAHRLKLDDRDRVSLFARRFYPAACLVMGQGSRITYARDGWIAPHEVMRLGVKGDLEKMDEEWRPHERRAVPRR